MTIQDADVFPLGTTIFDGLYVVESPLRGDPERGQYRARAVSPSGDEPTVLVTMTSRQTIGFDQIEDALAMTADGVAALRGLWEVRSPLGGVYACLIEEEPPGRPIADLRLPVSPAVAARVARGIWAALDDAHGYGWILGTMRPELVYVEGTGDAIQFSQVAPRCERFFQTASATDVTMPIFDRLYQAPEMLRGEKPSRASDVFSLVAMLAEWSTGEHPFPGASAQEQLFAIIGGKRRPFTGSPALRDLVERGLAPDPSRRPSLIELRDLLEAID